MRWQFTRLWLVLTRLQGASKVELSTGYVVDFQRLTQARADNPSRTRTVRRN